MANPIDDQDSITKWSLEAQATESARATRRLLNALIRDDRAEILTQFERAVRLWVSNRNWYDGLAAAREVFAAISRWEDLDSVPYALTVAKFAHNYAIELEQAGLLGTAEELYEEALRLFDTDADSFGRMVTLHQLGRVRQASGNHVEAERAYGESLDIARERGDLYRVGINVFQLAQLAQLRGLIDESETLYLEVLAFDDDIPSAPLMVGARHQLGLISQAREQYPKAKQWFEQALERSEREDYVVGKADALHQLGMIAQAEGDLAHAEEMYQASLVLSSRWNDSNSVPTLYQLALCAYARKDFVNAVSYCQRSLSIVQAMGNMREIARVRQLLNLIVP